MLSLSLMLGEYVNEIMGLQMQNYDKVFQSLWGGVASLLKCCIVFQGGQADFKGVRSQEKTPVYIHTYF